MKHGTGELTELTLENGQTGGRLLCPQNLVPSPGQYLLAHDPVSDSPLPAPIFSAGPAPGGFLVAPPLPPAWRPGTSLSLRGPLGQGFSVPASARCIALIALAETAARLKPLLAVALGQGASVVLVSDLGLPDLPPEVEVQPVSALADVAQWAEYMAIDLFRGSLPGLREKLGFGEHVGASRQARAKFEAQALVITPITCGGIAECGVCALTVRRGWKMACRDGPVFDLKELT